MSALQQITTHVRYGVAVFVCVTMSALQQITTQFRYCVAVFVWRTTISIATDNYNCQIWCWKVYVCDYSSIVTDTTCVGYGVGVYIYICVCVTTFALQQITTHVGYGVGGVCVCVTTSALQQITAHVVILSGNIFLPWVFHPLNIINPCTWSVLFSLNLSLICTFPLYMYSSARNHLSPTCKFPLHMYLVYLLPPYCAFCFFTLLMSGLHSWLKGLHPKVWCKSL